MIIVSKLYPHTLFTLIIISEDHKHTRAYFKNGKFQDANAKIYYESFDEGKLL